MQVYVVTSGAYSDYGINAIFSTKEKAEEYVKMMKFTDFWDEGYYINTWEVDKECENETVDLCMIDGEVKKLDEVYHDGSTFAICEVFDMKNDYSSRVVEITRDEINRYIDESHDDEFDRNIEFPVYVVCKVKYNPDFSVMEKTVYDEIARYKAEKAGL